LDWVETGRADDVMREHVKLCPICTAELASLQEVFRMVSSTEPEAELDEMRAEQFRQDLRRKIRLLPAPGAFRQFWVWLRGTVFPNPAVIGVVATAVLIFSIVTVFNYDRMKNPVESKVAGSGAGNVSRAEALAASLEVAYAVAADPSLKPSDFIEATVDTSQIDEAEVSDVTGVTPDPFHALSDLSPEEVSRLKTMLKEKLKS
jgi:hypothetical protein